MSSNDKPNTANLLGMNTVTKCPNESIHPRVIGGRTVFPKSNTAKKRRSTTVQRVLAAIQAHVERHPRDAASRARIATLQGALGKAG